MSEINRTRVTAELRAAEHWITARTDRLRNTLETHFCEIEELAESSNPMTSAAIAGDLRVLAENVSWLADQLLIHLTDRLTADDLDDSAKAIGISGGFPTSVSCSRGTWSIAQVDAAQRKLASQGERARIDDAIDFLAAHTTPDD
jgi:hypothetical protein